MKYLFSLACFFFAYTLCAQDGYWQQEVDYVIDAEFFPEQDSLSGNVKLIYTNNSPDALEEIYFHLWLNAHSSTSTAFSKQLVAHGNKDFYIADDSQRGGISGIDFFVNDQQVDAVFSSNEPEIIKLPLPAAVQPGQSVTISTPFEVQLPFLFSRPGFDGQVYHFTQWFPKPAVYDADGWHLMPYLDMGEYYAEFGQFEVNIFAPGDMVIAATGELQNESEVNWLEALETATRNGIKDQYSFDEVAALKAEKAATTRLWTFKQDRIHDFAWFASKDFLYLQKPVLIGEETVQARAFFLEDDVFLWEQAPNYIAQGLSFYSEKVGDYPYAHCTAVGGALQAGGGMEYPMITVISPTDNDIALKTVIVHEVGHNWFQSMLGSNERSSPWLDEGINSLYEEWALGAEIGVNDLEFRFQKLGYSLMNSRHTNQAITEASQKLTPTNYYLDIYGAGAFATYYLKEYLGESAFTAGMQDYFNTWKFKHPNNESLQRSLEKASGKDLMWFFQQLIVAEQTFDYKVKGLEGNNIRIENTTNIEAPFTLTYLDETGKILEENWQEGFTGEALIPLSRSDFHQVKIFHRELFPETNRQNNSIKSSGLFPKNEKIKLVGLKSGQNVLAGKSDQPLLFLTPSVLWNAVDKFSIGPSLTNTSLIEKPFEYTLLPNYSFGSSDLVGMGEVRYTIFPESTTFQYIRPSIRGRQFHYNTFQDVELKYIQAQPQIEFAFKKPEVRSSVQKKLILQSRINWIEPEPDVNTTTNELIQYDLESEVFNTLEFIRENDRPFNPNTGRIWVEQNENFGKLSGEYKYRYDFKNEDRHVWFRAFGGTMLYTETGAPTISRFTAMSRYNNTDYALRDLQLDRTGAVYSGSRFFYDNVETNNFQNNWIRESDGGLKMKRYSANLSEVVGEWMAATNVAASVPVDLPFGDLRVFGDLAVFQDLGLTEAEQTRALYDVGISYGFSDFFRLYYPLAFSDEFKPDIDDLTFSEKLTFSLQANPLELKEAIRKRF
ncbi:MAG: M1 family metallopeptidase [Saprospiraceae bacterium]|nr:M1 family metallopeptidase [Saprospiraceae bacterium]